MKWSGFLYTSVYATRLHMWIPESLVPVCWDAWQRPARDSSVFGSVSTILEWRQHSEWRVIDCIMASVAGFSLRLLLFLLFQHFRRVCRAPYMKCTCLACVSFNVSCIIIFCCSRTWQNHVPSFIAVKSWTLCGKIELPAKHETLKHDVSKQNLNAHEPTNTSQKPRNFGAKIITSTCNMTRESDWFWRSSSSDVLFVLV